MNRLGENLGLPSSIALAAAFLSLLVHLPFANDDFDLGHESIIGARFQGPIQRAYLSGGFFGMGGRPLLTPLPTRPPSGDTYASHPPLAHWLFHIPVRLFGLSEFSLRIIPIISSALTAFLLAGFLTLRMGRLAGLATVLFWPSLPLVFFFGRMANYESLVFLFGLGAALLFLRNTKRDLVFGTALLATATFTDWAAGFFLPGIALICWHAKMGWRPILAASAAVVVPVLLYLGLLIVWEDGFAGAQMALANAKSLAQETQSFGLSEFLGQQWAHLAKNFGIGAGIILGLSVSISAYRLFRGTLDTLDQLVLLSCVAHAFNIGLFPARAFDHDFWCYYLLLAVVVSIVRCVSSIVRRNKILGALLLLALIAEGSSKIVQRYAQENVGESQIIAKEVDRRFGEEDLVIMQGNFGSWQFICKPWIYDAVKHEAEAKDIVAKFLAGELKVKSLGLWYPVSIDYANPDGYKAMLALGATREHYGESTIIKFER